MNTNWNNVVVRPDLNAHNFEAHSAAETLAQLADLISQGKAIDARKQDDCADINMIRSIGGQLAYPNTTGMFAGTYTLPQGITDHAWGQLMAKLSAVVFKGDAKRLSLELSGLDEVQADDRGAKSMPRRYLEAIPTDLLDMILNYHFEHAPQDRRWWMRSITGTGDEITHTIRAVVGSQYPVTYGNTGLLETLYGLLDKHQARFPQINLVRPQLTDHDLNATVIYYSRDTDDGNYGIGFKLRNNELGTGYYSVYGAIQRGPCTNTIAVDLGDALHIRHRGSTPTIKEQIYQAIGTALKLGDDLIDEFLATREVAIPDFEDVIDGLALKYGTMLNDGVKGIVKEAAAVQGGATKFGLINGVTWAAHQASDLTPRQRGDLEVFGGALMVSPGSLFAQAAAATKAKREGRDPALNFAVAGPANRNDSDDLYMKEPARSATGQTSPQGADHVTRRR